MKEKLIDIVQSIDTYAEKRKGTHIVVVARVHCLYNGQDKTFWFTQGENINLFALEVLCL